MTSSGMIRENVSTQLDKQKELLSMTASKKVLSLNPITEIDEVTDTRF